MIKVTPLSADHVNVVGCIEYRISGGVSHLAVKNTDVTRIMRTVDKNSNAERHCAMCEDSKNTHFV